MNLIASALPPEGSTKALYTVPRCGALSLTPRSTTACGSVALKSRLEPFATRISGSPAAP